MSFPWIIIGDRSEEMRAQLSIFNALSPLRDRLGVGDVHQAFAAAPRRDKRRRRQNAESAASAEDRDFEEALAAARRASLLDQQTKDNESRLDDTLTLVRGDSGFANAVTDLKEDCVVCLENLYKAEPNQSWCGALRVPCAGCDGKGPFVHAKCAERMDGKCPVCRGDVKNMFA